MASWIICDCGNRLHKNLFCGAGVYRLIRDDEFDALPETADADAFGLLFVDSPEVLHCTACGRFMIRWKRGGDYTVYVKEKSKADPG